MDERWSLAISRLREISSEHAIGEPYGDYFRTLAAYICYWIDAIEDFDRKSQEDKKALNYELYKDILPENYDKSYGNPAYAVEKLGNEMGAFLSFLYAQERGIIPYAFELACDNRRKTDIVILMELFLEVYSAFAAASDEGLLPEAKEIKNILYYFVSDYADVTVTERVHEQVDPSIDFFSQIVKNADLEDISYLYSYGEYISENELETASFLNTLSDEAIQIMADTYTEGYRIGFKTTGKDLSIKSTVDIRYRAGFERVVRAAIGNFEKMGLSPIIYRTAVHAGDGSQTARIGFYGAIPNMQYDYDHKEDAALFMDKAYKDRKLEILKSAYEERKELARGYAGPAVMEVFGENPFSPAKTPGCLRYNEKQQRLATEYASAAGRIVNEYIKGEERSYTIIAFPIPEIGPRYQEIFEETIRLNTLDYETYKRIQQSIIDVLDKGVSVKIVGCGDNMTDLSVGLRHLDKPESETQFENCVADVNIPVGEVFTSPVLEGTNGRLHVTEVYLEGLKFTDLDITFKNGFVEKYSCSNFEDEKLGREYIKENVLYHHDTLPMGEFAIGTNTTAYAMAKRFDIFDRLPILIAEKTGPHFAVGDTCYSHAEDIPVYNPDGKEIISRDNSCSLKRTSDPASAYFNCHTDITIPYEEIGRITVVLKDGENIDIIRDGRFVLEGALELNKPLT